VKQDWARQLDPDAGDEFTTGIETQLALPGVVPGSVVAFDSLECMRPHLALAFEVLVGGRDPVLRWELEADNRWYVTHTAHARLVPRNLEPWTREIQLAPDRSLKLHHLPGRSPEELGTPGSYECRPWVHLAFTGVPDQDLPEAESTPFGKSALEVLSVPDPPPGELPELPGEPLARLRALASWMRHTFTYRKVYLDANRGWKPAAPSRTLRERHGDCKDLAALAGAAARKAGFQAFPVLARIGNGRLRGEEPVRPHMFNHALAAIEVPPEVDLPAVVTVGGARYLLFDPTSRLTPIGWLPWAHRQGKVLLCLPSGGHWVDIPRGAIPEARLDVSLSAKVEPSGTLAGTLVFQERGDALGLASTALQEGPAGLRKALVPILAPGPAGWFDHLKTSDPLDLDHPFQVEVSLVLPDAVESGALKLPGLPPVPRPIQRLGTARRLAIRTGRDLEWHWRGDLAIDGGRVPVHPDLALQTPLREILWKASATPGGWKLAMDARLREGDWEVARAAEGLEVFDKDRHAFRRFLASCLEVRSEAPRLPSGSP
jgi:hypothetical protein